ncbi:MAG: hypothetical protein K6F81_06200 [Acholeplasmatales bacterium]|nr:hypothetical protein [Acholeplasmatales bacterium]
MTLDELLKIKDETMPQLSLRVNQCPVKIFVAAGDEGIKKGSRLVLQKALDTVYNLGLKNVMVTQMPKCEEGNEVAVNVYMDDGILYQYVKVTPESIERIITEHIVGKKVVSELLLKEDK